MAYEIRIEICWGASSAERKERLERLDTLVSDLINSCKKDYGLPGEREGEMIRYALYRGQSFEKERLDRGRTLRTLRIQNGEVLYIAPDGVPWWKVHTDPPTTPSQTPPETRAPAPSPVEQRPIPCTIELAPGCVQPIGEAGLIINREYLMRTLPASVMALERARNLLNFASRLQSVSRSERGHCFIGWRQGWYLYAYEPVYIGGVKYSRGEAIALEQTTTLLLGREGWPVTVRLNSMSIPI